MPRAIRRFVDPTAEFLYVPAGRVIERAEELTPQSAGLLAISLGLSQNFPDDIVMLEHGMLIYDALYGWVKSARGEVHNADLFRK